MEKSILEYQEGRYLIIQAELALLGITYTYILNKGEAHAFISSLLSGCEFHIA